MSWNICYKTHSPRNIALRTVSLFHFPWILTAILSFAHKPCGPTEGKDIHGSVHLIYTHLPWLYTQIPTPRTQNKDVVQQAEKFGLGAYALKLRCRYPQVELIWTRFIKEQITFKQVQLSYLYRRTLKARTPSSEHTLVQSSLSRHTRCRCFSCEQCQETPQGNMAHLLPFCAWAEVLRPRRQQDNLIWQIPACAGEKTVPVQTVIPWEAVMSRGNTENSDFPVRWGRMIHEIFQSHYLYHAVSCTEVRGHATLCCGPHSPQLQAYL